MISDPDLAHRCKNLAEYYNALFVLQARAHGVEYLKAHEEITRRMEGCDRYTEFGVNQGTTLAAAMLYSRVKTVRAYDLDLTPFHPARRLFDQCAMENGIHWLVIEQDTLKAEIEPTDVLYIDSRHKGPHLTGELQRHGAKVKKHIICHDTYSARDLYKAATQYAAKNGWQVVTDCRQNTGFMTLSR